MISLKRRSGVKNVADYAKEDRREDVVKKTWG